MSCPRCRHDNPAGAKFCSGCGARLEAICPACGHANLPGSRFCNECGGPVAAASGVALEPASPRTYTPRHLVEKILTSRHVLEGERKQVTVLFADMKGSLELLADRDPEEARKLLDPVLERMMEAVHRYEGTVNQVMGDGIMALFGAPLAHEDHAVRACYAALAMQQAIHRYTAEVRRDHGIEIQIRVGLHSGEVVVRAIGSDLRMDYSAVGQTTHLAARMEQLATPGSTRLTGDTLRLAEGFVQVVPIGPIPVKGLASPVDVFELSGPSATRTRLQAAAARGLTRFVGRGQELDHLRQALEKARGAQGQIVAVVGEPGVGKSRLLWEFIHSHRTQDWLVLESSSVSYGKASAYLPVIDLCRAEQGPSLDGYTGVLGPESAGHLWWMGDHEHVIRTAQRDLGAIPAMGTFGALALVVTTNLRLGQAHHSLAQYARAIEILRKNVERLTGELLHERCFMSGLPAVLSRTWLAMCLAERGEFDEALGFGEEALGIAESADPGYSFVVGCAGLGNVCVSQGDFARAVAVLERGLPRDPIEPITRVWPFVASALGAAYTGAGRVDEALPLLEEAVERAAAMKLMANHSLRLVRLAEAHAWAGRPERAFPFASQALDLAQEHAERGHEAHTLRLLASIAMEREAPDLDRAEEGYRKALALAEELGMRPLQAHCHLGLGRLYQRRGDREAAAALAAARDLFRSMDMTFWLQEAQ